MFQLCIITISIMTCSHLFRRCDFGVGIGGGCGSFGHGRAGNHGILFGGLTIGGCFRVCVFAFNGGSVGCPCLWGELLCVGVHGMGFPACC